MVSANALTRSLGANSPDSEMTLFGEFKGKVDQSSLPQPEELLMKLRPMWKEEIGRMICGALLKIILGTLFAMVFIK